MHAILVGPETELAAALREHGVETTQVDGTVTASTLAAAGVEDADLLVVTDVSEATAVPVAREANPGLRVVVYAAETMPEFVRGQVDLAVAPGVLGPDAIAEELAADDG